MNERVLERANQQHGAFFVAGFAAAAHGRELVALLPGVAAHGEVRT
ncbi:MAG: hypothetical protein ACR2HQ_11760 [Ilumatobacteraceae bacterium]